MCSQPPVVSDLWSVSNRQAVGPVANLRLTGVDGRLRSERASRSGFTMMELLLVLAIIVIVCAISWTSIVHSYDGIRLKRAGEQVMTAFGHARVVAMSKGLTQVFRCQSNTPRYTIDALPDDSDPATSDGSSGSSSSLGGGGSGQTLDSMGKLLPDGFVFTNAERATDNRTAAAESQLSNTSSGGNSDMPPVMFFPDGTSSEASVTVSDKNGLSITVTLRGLTSTTGMGDVFRASPPTL